MNLLLSVLLTINAAGMVTCPGNVELYASADMQAWTLQQVFTNQGRVALDGTNRFYRARVKGSPVQILWITVSNTGTGCIVKGRCTKLLTNLVLTVGTDSLAGYTTRRGTGLVGSSNPVAVVQWTEFAFPKTTLSGAATVSISDIDGFLAVTNLDLAQPVEVPQPSTPPNTSVLPGNGTWQVDSESYVYSYVWDDSYWGHHYKHSEGTYGETNSWLYVTNYDGWKHWSCAAGWQGGGDGHMQQRWQSGYCGWATNRLFIPVPEIADYADAGTFYTDAMTRMAQSGSSINVNYGTSSNVLVRIGVNLWAMNYREGDEIYFDSVAPTMSQIGSVPATGGQTAPFWVADGSEVDCTPSFPPFWKGWIEYWPSVTRIY